MKSKTRSTAIVVHQQQILTFYAIDPKSNQSYHFLPGGTVEPHETAPEAATRETLEETGYVISIDPFSAWDEEYDFHWNGETYHCLTVFYRGYLVNDAAPPAPVNDDSYNKKVVWVPLSQVDEVFAYSQEIKRAVKMLTKD